MFDNTHGGTYIGRCEVDYNVSGTTDRIRQSVVVPGAQVGSVDGIPLDAFDVKIHVDFEDGGDGYFETQSPSVDWPTGQCTIDLSGVWPWGSHAVMRDPDATP